MIQCPKCGANTLLRIVDEDAISNGLYDYKWILTIRCLYCENIFNYEEFYSEREKRLNPYVNKKGVENDQS